MRALLQGARQRDCRAGRERYRSPRHGPTGLEQVECLLVFVGQGEAAASAVRRRADLGHIHKAPPEAITVGAQGTHHVLRRRACPVYVPPIGTLLHGPPLLGDLEVGREPDVGEALDVVKRSSSSLMRGWRPMQNGCTTSRKHPPPRYEPSNSAFQISSTCEGVESPDMYGKKLNRKYGASSSSQLTGSSTRSRSGPPTTGTRGPVRLVVPEQAGVVDEPVLLEQIGGVRPERERRRAVPRGVCRSSPRCARCRAASARAPRRCRAPARSRGSSRDSRPRPPKASMSRQAAGWSSMTCPGTMNVAGSPWPSRSRGCAGCRRGCRSRRARAGSASAA